MKHVETGGRDAYWAATREQLKSAQNRADLFTLLGLTATCGWLWLNHEKGAEWSSWVLGGVAVALAVICLPLWFVTRRKRHISAVRGLTCPHCGHVPHDTEIRESVITRQCQSCDQPLD